MVKLTFDTNNHATDAGIDYLEDQNILNAWDSYTSMTIAGSFQGWNNANAATLLEKRGNLDFLAYDHLRRRTRIQIRPHRLLG